jgi:hypothetical protein
MPLPLPADIFGFHRIGHARLLRVAFISGEVSTFFLEVAALRRQHSARGSMTAIVADRYRLFRPSPGMKDGRRPVASSTHNPPVVDYCMSDGSDRISKFIETNILT